MVSASRARSVGPVSAVVADEPAMPPDELSSERRTAGEQSSSHANRDTVARAAALDAIRPLITALNEQHGFETDVGHLTVFGRCAECQTRASQSGAAPPGLRSEE